MTEKFELTTIAYLCLSHTEDTREQGADQHGPPLLHPSPCPLRQTAQTQVRTFSTVQDTCFGKNYSLEIQEFWRGLADGDCAPPFGLLHGDPGKVCRLRQVHEVKYVNNW